MRSAFNFQQERTAFCDILHYAQIHTYDAKVERTPQMPDIDMQILVLFHQLNADQKQEFICYALSMLKAAQEEAPSGQQSTPS